MSEQNNTETMSWNMKIVDWFSRNTQLAILLFLGVIFGGTFSLLSLRSEGFPSPNINVAVITTLYPGASSQVVERQVVVPIEDAIRTVAGIGEIRSTAADSFSSVIVTFDAGTDGKTATAELRNKVQNVTLPAGAERPEISVPEIGGNSSFYAIIGNDDPAKLRKGAEIVRSELATVSGVRGFDAVTDLEDKAVVTLDFAKAAALGVTPLDLRNALTANNVTFPAGTIEQSGRQLSVVTSGSIGSIEELKGIVVKAVNNRPVRLGDVAIVERRTTSDQPYLRVGYKAAEDASALTFANGLTYALKYSSTEDLLETNKAVEEALERAEAQLSAEKMELVTLFDVSEGVREQIREVVGGAIGAPIGEGPLRNAGYILGAIWLISIALISFVSWRAALISIVSIPLTVLLTMIFLAIEGISLNTLTLFSLVLVLGLVIDPSLVILEAIQRQLDMGKRGMNAVMIAMRQVGNGVWVAVLTNTIVFVPFGLVSGIFGEIIRFIPITVIPALLASYFVPVVFLTYLSQKFLKPRRDVADDEEVKNLWKISQWFVRTNTHILSKRSLQVAIIAAGIIVPLGISGALFATGKISPTQFSQPNDVIDASLTVEIPANATKERRAAVMQEVERVLAEDPRLYRFFLQDSQRNLTTYRVELVKRAARDAGSSTVIEELSGKLRALNKPTEGIYIDFSAQNIGGPQQTFPVAVNIYGDDLEALKKAAVATGDELRARQEELNVTRVEDGFTGVSNPQIEVVINRDKLAATGLPVIQVAQTLSALIGETDLTRFEQQLDGTNRTIQVVLENGNKPKTVGEVSATVLGASPRGVIRIGNVADVKETQGFSGINRLDGKRYVTVQAQVEDPLRGISAPSKAIDEFWTAERLKSFGLREDALDARGVGNDIAVGFRELFIALGVAVMLVYLVMVFFFRSFAQPFIILFAIPLGFIGVFPGLAAVGGQFGFLEILGIITLAGIAVNVGILLIDLANQKRAEGMPYKQAIAEASGIRFRAIFLTKITVLGGLLPLIILSPFWRSLSVVVLAGVLVSGILSLFTTPILYSWFIEFDRFLKEKVVPRLKRQN